MDKINIYDNFLTNEELEKCRIITANPNWEYGHTSGTRNNSNIITPFWYMELNKNYFFTDQLKCKIEEKLNKKFKILRVYANGQTFGQDGSYHQDSENDKHITFCIYIAPVPNECVRDLNGHILFQIPELDHFIVGVEPVCNRAVSFPSNYYHKGTTFCRYFQNMRICIAYKLEEIQSHSEKSV